jgi:hypothetical protein
MKEGFKYSNTLILGLHFTYLIIYTILFCLITIWNANIYLLFTLRVNVSVISTTKNRYLF